MLFMIQKTIKNAISVDDIFIPSEDFATVINYFNSLWWNRIWLFSYV